VRDGVVVIAWAPALCSDMVLPRFGRISSDVSTGGSGRTHRIPLVHRRQSGSVVAVSGACECADRRDRRERCVEVVSATVLYRPR